MSAIKIMVKGWVKVLPFYLLILLPLFMSCSEADDTPEEYANWQAKNEAYFEEQYQKHLAASSSTCFVLKSYTKGDKLNVSEVAHTDCILVDVLPSDFPSKGDKTTSPLFTDDADIHYRGYLLPSLSYPTGYVFDISYSDMFAKNITGAEPATMSVDALIAGFSTALQHMHRGDYWRVTIPYQLGYGSSDYSSIPAFSTLIFEIRLVDFEPATNG